MWGHLEYKLVSRRLPNFLFFLLFHLQRHVSHRSLSLTNNATASANDYNSFPYPNLFSYPHLSVISHPRASLLAVAFPIMPIKVMRHQFYVRHRSMRFYYNQYGITCERKCAFSGQRALSEQKHWGKECVLLQIGGFFHFSPRKRI